MYYIDRPNSSRPANRKCEELVNYVDKYFHCLVSDEETKNFIIDDLKKKVDDLNNRYPRTRPVCVRFYSNLLSVEPEQRNNDSDNVLTIYFHPVSEVISVNQ